MKLHAIAVLMLLGPACGGDENRGHEPEPFTPTAATVAYCGADTETIEARITDLLAQLTVAEKVSLMHGERGLPVDLVWAVTGIPELDIPGLHMLDGPRGVSSVAEVTATDFPVAMARGASWDPDLEQRVGAAIAREARATGADVLLAPTINILRHPRWGRAQETYGEDVYHLGAMGVAFIRGAQSERVIASVKHFAVNSIEDTRNDVDVAVDERTLREIYLPHFRRAVTEAQVGSVMSAYNSVNGHFCDRNAHLLTDILKEEWEFQGFVESDWYFATHADVESVRAGLDIEMPAGLHFSKLIDRVNEGAISEHELDRSVRRILRAQLCFGLDVDPPVRDASQRETQGHKALALEAARKGIVLLKNESNALPIARGSASSIAVLGRLADAENTGDVGSSSVTASSVVTAVAGISARAGASLTVNHIPSGTLSGAEQAVVSAADAAIVVVGLGAGDEGEGLIGAGDRDGLGLDAASEALIAEVASLNPRTIVVLEGGAAITMGAWLADVPAVMMAWYPGQEGGLAIADVLFGDVNPSGRLPISFPVAEADLPPFDNTSLSVTYDYFHGYRHLERNQTPALFAFGHGLSYTTFTLSNPRVAAASFTAADTIELQVDVGNAGTVAGVETVQLYVSASGSRVMRSPQELKAFARVELAPGQTKTATLSVPVADLAFYDVVSSSWVVEAIDYQLRVGKSSVDQLPPLTISVSP